MRSGYRSGRVFGRDPHLDKLWDLYRSAGSSAERSQIMAKIEEHQKIAAPPRRLGVRREG
jgi:hypothetical protein